MGCGKSKLAKEDISREVAEKAHSEQTQENATTASPVQEAAAAEVLQAPIDEALQAKTETVEMAEIALEDKPLVQEQAIDEVEKTIVKEEEVEIKEELAKPKVDENTVAEEKDDFEVAASPGKLKSASVTEIINQWNKTDSTTTNRQARSASTPHKSTTHQDFHINRGTSVKDKIAFFGSANPQNSSSGGINHSLRTERHASVQDETSGRLAAGKMAKYWEAVEEVNKMVVTTKTF